ncbi:MULTISPECIES: hypothetical protein [unclassified Myroides]|uniref:hypothetical protein n=1 Tax=unclassified Myroides TaxID=2642485 RepID=UPI003D2F6014
MNHKAQNNRKDGFQIPEGYLNSFDERLFERLNGTQIQAPQSKGIFVLTPKKMMAIAATIVLFLGLGVFIKTQLTASLSEEALENYLEYNPSSYTLSNEFIQAFDESDIKELEQGIQINQKEINEYVQTNIDLEYYLNY